MTVFEGSNFTSDYLVNTIPSAADLFAPSGLNPALLSGYTTSRAYENDTVKFVDAPGKNSQIVFDNDLLGNISSYDDGRNSFNHDWKTDYILTIENFTPKEDAIYNDSRSLGTR